MEYYVPVNDISHIETSPTIGKVAEIVTLQCAQGNVQAVRGFFFTYHACPDTGHRAKTLKASKLS